MFGRLSGEKAAFKVAGGLVKFDTLLLDVPRTFFSVPVAAMPPWPAILELMGDMTEFWPSLNPEAKAGLFLGDMNYCLGSMDGFPTTSCAAVVISSFLLFVAAT